MEKKHSFEFLKPPSAKKRQKENLFCGSELQTIQTHKKIITLLGLVKTKGRRKTAQKDGPVSASERRNTLCSKFQITAKRCRRLLSGHSLIPPNCQIPTPKGGPRTTGAVLSCRPLHGIRRPPTNLAPMEGFDDNVKAVDDVFRPGDGHEAGPERGQV